MGNGWKRRTFGTFVDYNEMDGLKNLFSSSSIWAGASIPADLSLLAIALLFMHMHDRVARGWQLGQWKEEFIQVQWEVSRQIGQAVEESSQQSSNTLNQKLERGRKREREEKFVQVDHTDEITFKKVVKSLKFRKSYIQLKEIISMHGEHSEMSAVAENGSNYN